MLPLQSHGALNVTPAYAPNVASPARDLSSVRHLNGTTSGPAVRPVVDGFVRAANEILDDIIFLEFDTDDQT